MCTHPNECGCLNKGLLTRSTGPPVLWRLHVLQWSEKKLPGGLKDGAQQRYQIITGCTKISNHFFFFLISPSILIISSESLPPFVGPLLILCVQRKRAPANPLSRDQGAERQMWITYPKIWGSARVPSWKFAVRASSVESVTQPFRFICRGGVEHKVWFQPQKSDNGRRGTRIAAFQGEFGCRSKQNTRLSGAGASSRVEPSCPARNI